MLCASIIIFAPFFAFLLEMILFQKEICVQESKHEATQVGLNIFYYIIQVQESNKFDIQTI